MMDRPEMRALVPVWSAATDALLDGHLPSKLAFRGRLDVTDKTREGFYVPRHAERRFPVLEELLEDRTCPVRPVYVCYFERAAPPEPPPPPEQPADRSSGRKSVQNNNKKAASSQGQEEVKMSPPEDRSIYLTDPYLPEYLQQLQKTLTIPKEPQDASANRIEERARIVAQFVADQMSGRDPEEACDARQLELHLYQLKVFLETNVIPLGHLRVGTHLERAVLFKVLADRLGLPCALVRGPYGRSWVEVAVPQGDNVDGEGT
ncbi:armadillo repeat-containing protein 3 isoform X2 [Bacillus rossius redtenbacheri]|uniref:armadillo repeat-containing protein 3 isoform X2 n=1 Tax=Bacillus rossius redtenbacheri TaxID=93214 RepID=UPI002FDDAF79